MRSRALNTALTAACLLVAAGCASSDQAQPATSASPGGDRPVVVTDLYPTTFAVQQVAGDAVEIIQLAPPGVEPHDYELTPRQVQQIADAALVAHLPGMIPAVEEAIAQEAADRAVDVTAGITRLAGAEHAEDEEHAEEEDHAEDGDPHVWLDPANMATMGSNVAQALTAIGVAADAAPLTEAMTALDAELGTDLASCAVQTMVVSHEAFGYLAEAYGFTQVGISGLSPDAEPSPARLAEITELVRADGVTTVYFESAASPGAVEALAAETGAATALLDPIEGNTEDRGYPALMQANGATLQAGQSCS